MLNCMNYWNEPLIIAQKSYPRFVGGPLDGITDAPFRQLVRTFCTQSLLYTEMRHAACIAPGGIAARRALRFEPHERPLNFQLAASDTHALGQALERIHAVGVDLIDLNVGCPARNVIHSGCGSALMADMPRLKEILLYLERHTPVPFTVKIRAGFKEQNAVDVAQLVQDCGARALAIHPRLQTQKFQGRPDYVLAARVKRAVTIPVLLSGNVVNWTTAQIAYQETGVDGFLIGRGLWSRPWKLHELNEQSQGKEYTVNTALRVQTALRHLESNLAYYGSPGLYMFRKFLPLYIQGIAGAATLRAQLMVSESVEQVREGLLRVAQ